MDIVDYVTVVAIAVISMLLIGVLIAGINKQEKWECEKWGQQAKHFEYFHWTDWQLEQCKGQK